MSNLPNNLRLANSWRSQYNPLRNLTLQRAVSLLEAGERGEYADLQWTYRYIERRDATLRGLVKLRTSAIRKLDWEIKTVDDSPAAKAQAEQLRAAYESISNLNEAIAFLALAEFRGFSHLEKRYEGDNPSAPIIRLEPVPQWNWVRGRTSGEWEYNASAASVASGQPIEREHFIIREVDAPIDEIALISFIRKNLSQKDWDGFVDTYGIPPLFAEMPANADPAKANEYQALAEAVVSDMRGVLPAGAKMQTVDAGARGANPFRDHLTYQDEQLVLAGTSGKLTMLNGPTGLGSGQSDAHQDTFDSLAQAEAEEISGIFQEQLDAAILGEGPRLAYFDLCAEEQVAISTILDDALKASQAGLQIAPEQLAEKTGYKITLKPAAPAPSYGFGGGAPGYTAQNRARALTPDAQALREASRRRIGEALGKQLSPLRDRLRAAMEAADSTEIDSVLSEIKAELPKQAAQLGADSDLVKAFEDSIGTAVLQGALDGAAAQRRP